MGSEVKENVFLAQPGAQSKGVRDRSLGRILLEAGKISLQDADRIINYQKREGILFGEAAVKLKLITADDLRRALATQFSYPYVRPGDVKFSKELITAFNPFALEAERFRGVRSQLLLHWFNEERRALAVMSPSEGDGCSYVTANLAVALSQVGERTLLIDADMRKARQHRIFNVPNDRGLSMVLAELAGDSCEIMLPFFQNLALLPAGPIPPNPQELLSRAAFKNLLADCQRRYDVIIVDTPPFSGTSDGEIVASRVGGVAVVVRKSVTRVAELAKLEQRLQDSNVPLVGSIYNCF